jgi:branched-chain amino acid transport system substrate-binding protein
VQQYDAFGLKEPIPLYGSGFLTDATILPAQGPAAVGVQTCMHYTALLDNPANTAFVEAYRGAYDASPTVYSVQAYDAAAVLDLAGAQAPDVSGAALSEALTGLGPIEESPRGTWRFEGHAPRQTFYQREVRQQDGGLVNAVVTELGEFAQPNLF